jgi:hypothetical protein
MPTTAPADIAIAAAARVGKLRRLIRASKDRSIDATPQPVACRDGTLLMLAQRENVPSEQS